MSDVISGVCASDLERARARRLVLEGEGIVLVERLACVLVDQLAGVRIDDQVAEVRDRALLRRLQRFRVARGQRGLGAEPIVQGRRSEALRVGEECVSTCRSSWSRYNKNKKK